ncbi:ParE toxin of type II toxin-antitoxin system, parDE [compost metagenome]
MKANPVIPRALANQDIDDALSYYLNEGTEQTALGFIDALERAYKQISRHPESGSSKYAHELDLPELCSRTLKRYPYLVFYIELDDHIDVWRVLHEMMDIPTWMQGNSGK